MSSPIQPEKLVSSCKRADDASYTIRAHELVPSSDGSVPESSAKMAELAMKRFLHLVRLFVDTKQEKADEWHEWVDMAKVLAQLQPLSRNRKAYKMFLKLGVLKSILQLLLEALPVDILNVCLSIVANLVSDSTLRKEIHTGIIDRLVDIISVSNSLLTRSRGLRALTNLIEDAKCKQALLSTNTLTSLVQWLSAMLPSWEVLLGRQTSDSAGDKDGDELRVPGGVVIVGAWMDRWQTPVIPSMPTSIYTRTAPHSIEQAHTATSTCATAHLNGKDNNKCATGASMVENDRDCAIKTIQSEKNRDFLYACLRLLAAVGTNNVSREQTYTSPSPHISTETQQTYHKHMRNSCENIIPYAFVLACYSSSVVLVNQALKVLYTYRVEKTAQTCFKEILDVKGADGLRLMCNWGEMGVEIRLRISNLSLVELICQLTLSVGTKRSVRAAAGKLVCILSEEAVTRAKIKRVKGYEGLVALLISSTLLRNTNPHVGVSLTRSLLNGLSLYRFDTDTLSTFFRTRPERLALRSDDIVPLLHSRDSGIITYTMLLIETATATPAPADPFVDATLLRTIVALIRYSPERSPLILQGYYILKHLICAHCLPRLVCMDVLKIIDGIEGIEYDEWRGSRRKSEEKGANKEWYVDMNLSANTGSSEAVDSLAVSISPAKAKIAQEVRVQLAKLTAETWGMRLLSNLLCDPKHRLPCALVLGITIPYLYSTSDSHTLAAEVMFNAEVNVADILLGALAGKSTTHAHPYPDRPIPEQTLTSTLVLSTLPHTPTQVMDETFATLSAKKPNSEYASVIDSSCMGQRKREDTGVHEGANVNEGVAVNEWTDLKEEATLNEEIAWNEEVASNEEVSWNENTGVKKRGNRRVRESINRHENDKSGRIRAARVLCELAKGIRTERDWVSSLSYTRRRTQTMALDTSVHPHTHPPIRYKTIPHKQALCQLKYQEPPLNSTRRVVTFRVIPPDTPDRCEVEDIDISPPLAALNSGSKSVDEDLSKDRNGKDDTDSHRIEPIRLSTQSMVKTDCRNTDKQPHVNKKVSSSEEVVFRVDKDDLCAVSPHFQRMLAGYFGEANQNEISITTMRPSAFASLLAYLLPCPFAYLPASLSTFRSSTSTHSHTPITQAGIPKQPTLNRKEIGMYNVDDIANMGKPYLSTGSISPPAYTSTTTTLTHTHNQRRHLIFKPKAKPEEQANKHQHTPTDLNIHSDTMTIENGVMDDIDIDSYTVVSGLKTGRKRHKSVHNTDSTVTRLSANVHGQENQKLETGIVEQCNTAVDGDRARVSVRGPLSNECCEHDFYARLLARDALELIAVAQLYMLPGLRDICIKKSLEHVREYPEQVYLVGLRTNLQVLQTVGIETVINMLPEMCLDPNWQPDDVVLNGMADGNTK
eukprot:CFRG2138T1